MKKQFSTTGMISGICSAVLLLILSTGCSFSYNEHNTENKTPYTVKTFDLSSGELFVSTSGGSIKVIGGDVDKVKVEMYVWSNKYKGEKLDEILEDDYEITIRQDGSRVEAIAKRTTSGWFKNGPSISFVVYTPKSFECETHTSGGSLNLSSVNGDKHILRTSGGSIRIEDVEGEIDANTSGGSVTVERIIGDADLKTSGGSINVTKLKGDLDANTSGGSINLKSIEGSVEAHTSGGGIHADMDVLKDRLVLSTSGGSVSATVPSGLGMDLDLRGNHVSVSLNNFSGESKNDRVNGTVNGGGILVKMSTSGGGINLNYK